MICRKELEEFSGVDIFVPCIFFIGFQPHALSEENGLKKGLSNPVYKSMSLMQLTARKLLWHLEQMGKEFGRISSKAFDTNPNVFDRAVMDLLIRDYGVSSLNEELTTVEAKNRPVLAKILR